MSPRAAHASGRAQPVLAPPRSVVPCGTIRGVDTSRLAAFSVLADLPVAELDALAAVMSEVEVEAGAEVITADDYGTAIYFIEQGGRRRERRS